MKDGILLVMVNSSLISHQTVGLSNTVGILSPVIGQWNPQWGRGGLVKGKLFKCVLSVAAGSFC